jgi:hypothetical protein
LAALATFLCAAAERLWRRCWIDAQNGFGPRAAKAFSLDSDDPAVHFPNLKVSAAKPACLCGLTPATSAPGLTPPLPHLHQDWAHRCHICTGTEAACTRGPAAAAAIALVARCASKGARVLTVLYGLEPHRRSKLSGYSQYCMGSSPTGRSKLSGYSQYCMGSSPTGRSILSGYQTNQSGCGASASRAPPASVPHIAPRG